MTARHEEVLSNGLKITFVDVSNRYFGDYHRVCLQVEISYALPKADEEGAAGFWSQARERLGDTVCVKKQLVRMGVSGAQVDATVDLLMDEFLRSAHEYMARSDYPQRLVQAELEKNKKVVRFS